MPCTGAVQVGLRDRRREAVKERAIEFVAGRLNCLCGVLRQKLCNGRQSQSLNISRRTAAPVFNPVSVHILEIVTIWRRAGAGGVRCTYVSEYQNVWISCSNRFRVLGRQRRGAGTQIQAAPIGVSRIRQEQRSSRPDISNAWKREGI